MKTLGIFSDVNPLNRVPCDRPGILSERPAAPSFLSYTHCLLMSSFTRYTTNLQLSGEGDDKATSERLASASAVFLALYEQPHTPVGATGGGCRLGELLRQVGGGGGIKRRYAEF